MPVLRKVDHTPGDGCADFIFWCPACKCGHGVWVSGPNRITGATWGFNGNMDKPTLQPSLKIIRRMWEPPVTPENREEFHKNPWPQTEKEHICHVVVTDGVLNFCGDCTHEFAGKSVPMEDF